MINASNVRGVQKDCVFFFQKNTSILIPLPRPEKGQQMGVTTLALHSLKFYGRSMSGLVSVHLKKNTKFFLNTLYFNKGFVLFTDLILFCI